MTSSVLSTVEAARLAGVSYRQAHYWTRAQIITPTVRPSNGSGSRMLWSDGDVVLLRVCGTLSALGASGEVLAEVVAYLVTTERRSGLLFVDEFGSCTDSLPSEPGSWCVDLDAIRALIDRDVIDLRDGA